MTNKKQHLINSLSTAIEALKNDTILYNWEKSSCCNAGIVSQAILGLDTDSYDTLRMDLFDTLSKKSSDVQKTWKNAVRYLCPVTGEGMPKIIKKLEEAGLSRRDIVHLEYMDNPAILKMSGIKKETKITKNKVGETIKIKLIDNPSVIGRLFKPMITKEVKEPVYEEIIVESYPKDYYKDKDNLILYLSGWVKILQSEVNSNEDTISLESQLLHAVAEENYELAAKIRNKLAVV